MLNTFYVRYYLQSVFYTEDKIWERCQRHSMFMTTGNNCWHINYLHSDRDWIHPRGPVVTVQGYVDTLNRKLLSHSGTEGEHTVSRKVALRTH
jgi:Uri superfamily endonuclease